MLSPAEICRQRAALAFDAALHDRITVIPSRS
jgi:hypothetical protein